MPNQGFWAAALEGTADRLNAALLQYDTFANRPAAGQTGRLFYATDLRILYRDNGATWDIIAAQPTSGSYTGDDTVNRAIAHGLSVIPKIVLVTTVGGGNDGSFGRIQVGYANVIYLNDALLSVLSVTAPDSTNFYVGNATQYARSLNAAGLTYYWVAIA